ncbi:long-chain fatty acid--CoA ligase [Pseudohalioglobus sediminis]|uniref:Long-chain fatty acid--CoA ligase n=1 Tax=Pseudohalioglobus sediminis TaxID=2606449 RepID=A0A5B0X1J7_9GAMM|nr:long-chain fatty acid--CoA ligase [Pseudohalioglobus sediminis]KAA1193190.1 long-chain fatty acid--CoA ligase [Pseudohalioglobus sediminis]
MQTNIGLLLKKRAAITPANEAFVEWERQRRFTFRDLNQRCNRVANTLLEQGIQPGERVATLLKNGIEFVETYFAIAKIGAVMVPVNWRLTPAEIAYILEDAGASALVHDAEFDASISTLQQQGSDSARCRLWLRVVDEPASAMTATSLDYNQCLVRASDDEPAVGAWDDDNLFIMYTSGTTGHPKGAVHSHDGMLWSQLTSMATSDMRGDDRFLLPLPMFHVGCLNPVSLLVHRGGTGVIMRDLDMAQMFKCIASERISIFMAVPALLQFMLQAPERPDHDLSSLRWIATGAAPVPVSLLRAWRELGISIHQAYGLTESCGPGTLLLAADAERKAGSCGRPQMHTEVKIVDARGDEIPPGSPEAGELLLAGRHIMKGYWNNPQATAETLQDGWLHTGDICTADSEGFITLCDRKKDMIISGGENIYPAELENVLSACPEVQEAAVIGVASTKWGETPLALVVPAPGAMPTADSLRQWCREHLAGYKVPQLYELVDALPRNPSGKLLKPQLREAFPGPAPF